MRPLTQGMLDYAAQDTIHLLELRDQSGATSSSGPGGSTGRARSSRCSRERAWADDDADDAFLRMKGARDLSRRELAVLRELVHWRDGRGRAARSRDLPRRRQRAVARDRQAPARVARRCCAAIKGVPRGMIESAGRRDHRRGRSRAGRSGERAAQISQGGALGPRSRLRRARRARSRRCATRRRRGSTSTPACCARASVSRPWRAKTRRRPKSWRTCASSAPGSAACSVRIF